MSYALFFLFLFLFYEKKKSFLFLFLFYEKKKSVFDTFVSCFLFHVFLIMFLFL